MLFFRKRIAEGCAQVHHAHEWACVHDALHERFVEAGKGKQLFFPGQVGIQHAGSGCRRRLGRCFCLWGIRGVSRWGIGLFFAAGGEKDGHECGIE